MQYEIFGANMPGLTIHLERGESIYTQSGGMCWMTDRIRMETNMKGGLMKGLGRMLSGESLFMATYTSEESGQAITLASSFTGSIIPLDISNRMFICQKSAFLCAQSSVLVEATMPKGLKAGIFGGEGLIMQKVHGKGMVFLEIDGSTKEVNLSRGEKLVVDTGNIAAYESTVDYSAEMVKGFKNILFGGEGLFLSTLTGPGKVYLQTINMASFAGRIVPYLPHNNN